MSSSAVRPTWKPFASNTLAEQQLHFSLRLMTGGDSSRKEGEKKKESHKLSADVVQFFLKKTLICARRFG